MQAKKPKTVNLYKRENLSAIQRRLFLRCGFRFLFDFAGKRQLYTARGFSERDRRILRGIKNPAVLIDKSACIIYNNYL